MVLRRDVRVVKKRKRKEQNIVTQQVECFVPIGRVGHFENGGLMEVGTLSCYDCEGIWKGEKGTFDETVSGEYLTSSSGGGPETEASENESAAS